MYKYTIILLLREAAKKFSFLVDRPLRPLAPPPPPPRLIGQKNFFVFFRLKTAGNAF